MIGSAAQLAEGTAYRCVLDGAAGDTNLRALRLRTERTTRLRRLVD